MPPTCTALLNNFVFSTKWLLFSSQIIFLMDPCLCPRDLNPVCPPDSVDISILLMWPKLTELLRFSFCCGQTDRPTSAWYIILLYMFSFKDNIPGEWTLTLVFLSCSFLAKAASSTILAKRLDALYIVSVTLTVWKKFNWVVYIDGWDTIKLFKGKSGDQYVW